MKEAISKFTIFGSEYVKLEDLNELIRDMQRKTREGKEPGYMNQTKEQSIAVDVALGHLRVILNKERNFDGILCKLMKTRFEREEREAAEKEAVKDAEASVEPMKDAEKLLHDMGDTDETDEPKGSWMVYKPGKLRGTYWVFREWDNGDAVIGKDGGMVFTYKGMAEHVAELLGVGWVVIDVSQKACRDAERLLDALFRDDEPEYHGDGTKAEDEDWDEE